MMSQFQLRTFLKMLPAIGIAVALMAMLVQFTFKLPPISIQTSAGMQQYSSQPGQFSMLYPNGWFLTEAPKGNQIDPGAIALIDAPKIPPLGPSVVIYRSKVTFHSLAEVAAWGEQLNQKWRSYAKISTESLVINGEEMILREYTIQLAPSPLQSSPLRRCLDDYRLHNLNGYILSFCADIDDFSKVKPVFQQMIDSFNYLG